MRIDTSWHGLLSPIAFAIIAMYINVWGYSSIGRALRSQCRGRGFESPYLHQIPHAPVAQRIEQRFPKPCVVRSTRTRGIFSDELGGFYK